MLSQILLQTHTDIQHIHLFIAVAEKRSATAVSAESQSEMHSLM